MKWDNLNQVATNIHENNVHTEGIMIKEVKRDIDMNATIHERTCLCTIRLIHDILEQNGSEDSPCSALQKD